jgi:energy-coupling factor transporter ATP-binding protein EcfA2
MAGSQVLAARALLIASAVVPPSIATYFSWEAVKSQPVIALLLLFAYEVLLYVLSLSTKVAKGLESRLVDRATDRVEFWILKKTTRFERYYRRYITSIHHDVDLKGTSTYGAFSLAVGKVFVDLSLVPTPLSEATSNPVHSTRSSLSATRRYSIWELLGGPENTRLAVVGPPGAGKTTLLKHIANVLGGEDNELPKQHRLKGFLPFIVLLREHAAKIIEDPRITLAEIIRSDLARLRVAEPTGWLEDKLARGRNAILLDGLDEVPKRDDRRKVIQWAEREMSANNENVYVLTSRPYGMQPTPPAGATLIEIQPFTERQMSTFLKGWYSETYSRETGRRDVGVQISSAKDADDLMNRLRENVQLFELGVNPLLLTMMAHVHHYRNALPGSRAELYKEVCQVLLGKRQEAKGIASSLSVDQKDAILRSLALKMMRAGVQIVRTPRAIQMITSVLRRVDQDQDPREFLESIETSSGIVVERDTGMHSFAHKTLQEYLAASEIKEKSDLGTLLGTLGDEWWREVHLLYAAQSDASPLILACLTESKPAVEKLTLAMDLAAEAREVNPAVRKRLNEALSLDSLASSDPTGVRVRTAHFTRSLRTVVRLREDVYGVVRLITEADFQLFLDSGGFLAMTPFAQRQEPAPVPLTAARTITGIEYEDAVGFAAWVDAITGPEWHYRLPTEDDDILGNDRIRQVLEAGGYGVWTAEGAHIAGPGAQSSPGEMESMLARTLVDFLKAEKALSGRGKIGMARSRVTGDSDKPVEIGLGSICNVIACSKSFFLSDGAGPSGITAEERSTRRWVTHDLNSTEAIIQDIVVRGSSTGVQSSITRIRQLLEQIADLWRELRLSPYAASRGLNLIADLLEEMTMRAEAALVVHPSAPEVSPLLASACAAGTAACVELRFVGADTEKWVVGHTPASGLGRLLADTSKFTSEALHALIVRYGQSKKYLPMKQAIIVMRTTGTYSPGRFIPRGRHRQTAMTEPPVQGKPNAEPAP